MVKMSETDTSSGGKQAVDRLVIARERAKMGQQRANNADRK